MQSLWTHIVSVRLPSIIHDKTISRFGIASIIQNESSPRSLVRCPNDLALSRKLMKITKGMGNLVLFKCFVDIFLTVEKYLECSWQFLIIFFFTITFYLLKWKIRVSNDSRIRLNLHFCIYVTKIKNTGHRGFCLFLYFFKK